MQNERNTRRRVRIADNLYERPGVQRPVRATWPATQISTAVAEVTLRARDVNSGQGGEGRPLAKHRRGELAPATTVTVAELVAEYLAHLEALVAAGERAERTVERYRSHLEGHVVPALGRVQVRKLTADHLALLVRTSREKGSRSVDDQGNAHTPWARVDPGAAPRDHHRKPIRRLQPEELPKGVAKDRRESSLARRSLPCSPVPRTATGRSLASPSLPASQQRFGVALVRGRLQSTGSSRCATS